MVKMIDDIVDANRFAPFHQEGDIRDSQDAALFGPLSNGVVSAGSGCVRKRDNCRGTEWLERPVRDTSSEVIAQLQPKENTELSLVSSLNATAECLNVNCSIRTNTRLFRADVAIRILFHI
jgi:hypothetical protein